jgi:catechol 2,3-dioxygenase-like lactoylglutathione lyase family enzyme
MHRTKVPLLALMFLGVAYGASAQVSPIARPELVRVRYMVDDVPATVAFYTGKLGFKLDMQSGSFFAALSRGGVQLLVSPVKGPGGASQPMPNGDRPAPGGWNRLVLYTTDLQGEVDRLRKAGVHFRNEVVYGLGGNEILLDDPSGNAVELFQPTVGAVPDRPRG